MTLRIDRGGDAPDSPMIPLFFVGTTGRPGACSSGIHNTDSLV